MKRNSVNTTIEEEKTIRYDEKAIGRIIETRKIRQQAVLDIFNMSNPTTARNWMSGITAPPINRVLHLCSMLDLDPIEVISYYGYKFKSRLADLYLLEKGGKTVGDILRELKIEVMPEPTNTRPIDPDYADRMQAERDRLASLAHAVISGSDCITTGNQSTSKLNSLDFIDRIIAIQKEAQQHEADAIKEVRDEMQKKIDERDDTIQSLQRQVANANAENQMLRKYMDNGPSYARTGIIQDPGHITSHKDVTDI